MRELVRDPNVNAVWIYEPNFTRIPVMEAITFWSFVGPGLRLSLEVLGPEYYLQINTLNPELNVFFSREVKGKAGEDMVEKQTSEQGLMRRARTE